MRLPKPVRNWYEQFKKEGMPDKKALKEAIQRAYEEGDISESQADRLERTAGSIKGPGVPDGTGPMRDSDECPYSDDEADEMSEEKIARELVKAAKDLTARDMKFEDAESNDELLSALAAEMKKQGSKNWNGVRVNRRGSWVSLTISNGMGVQILFNTPFPLESFDKRVYFTVVPINIKQKEVNANFRRNQHLSDLVEAVLGMFDYWMASLGYSVQGSILNESDSAEELVKAAKELTGASNPFLVMVRESSDIKHMVERISDFANNLYDMDSVRRPVDYKQALIWLKEIKDLGRMLSAHGKTMQKLAEELIRDKKFASGHMASKPPAKVMKEVMDKYDEYRAKWIDKHGDDKGYDAWFTQQVMKKNPKLAKEFRTAASKRQVRFIVDLMVDAGHAHRKGYLRSSSKNVPYGPSMRERGGTVWDWADGLTPKQASEVIDYLLSE